MSLKDSVISDWCQGNRVGRMRDRTLGCRSVHKTLVVTFLSFLLLKSTSDVSMDTKDVHGNANDCGDPVSSSSTDL